jgi:peptide subunit release factor 1 (eRF1)
VKTDSTHPQAGLFTKKAETIARSLASKKVSPKGPSSGMRMLTYFINRAGRRLSASRRKELEKAKALLSKRIEHAKKTQAGGLVLFSSQQLAGSYQTPARSYR